MQVPLIYSITFDNHDDFLFSTIVSNRMVHATRCCVVDTSSCTLSPDPLESCKLIICIFLQFLFLGKSIISCFYSFPGNYFIANQIIYPTRFHQSYFLPWICVLCMSRFIFLFIINGLDVWIGLYNFHISVVNVLCEYFWGLPSVSTPSKGWGKTWVPYVVYFVLMCWRYGKMISSMYCYKWNTGLKISLRSRYGVIFINRYMIDSDTFGVILD